MWWLQRAAQWWVHEETLVFILFSHGNSSYNFISWKTNRENKHKLNCSDGSRFGLELKRLSSPSNAPEHTKMKLLVWCENTGLQAVHGTHTACLWKSYDYRLQHYLDLLGDRNKLLSLSSLWVEEMRGAGQGDGASPFLLTLLRNAEGIEAAKDRSASPAGLALPGTIYPLPTPALKALENAFHLQSTALNTLYNNSIFTSPVIYFCLPGPMTIFFQENKLLQNVLPSAKRGVPHYLWWVLAFRK